MLPVVLCSISVYQINERGIRENKLKLKIYAFSHSLPFWDQRKAHALGYCIFGGPSWDSRLKQMPLNILEDNFLRGYLFTAIFTTLPFSSSELSVHPLMTIQKK
jgi:hypothetical protein